MRPSGPAPPPSGRIPASLGLRVLRSFETGAIVYGAASELEL
jgi:hypothetical protein